MLHLRTRLMSIRHLGSRVCITPRGMHGSAPGPAAGGTSTRFPRVVGGKAQDVPDKDPLDVDAAIERLEHALPLQARSALAYAVASASFTGLEYVGMGDVLWRFAQADLDDLRRLSEKLVTLGGRPPSELPSLDLGTDPPSIVEGLIARERETIEALQDVIPTTGHTGDSEALEHRLEHLIMRKQEQVDTLVRALRSG